MCHECMISMHHALSARLRTKKGPSLNIVKFRKVVSLTALFIITDIGVILKKGIIFQIVPNMTILDKKQSVAICD